MSSGSFKNVICKLLVYKSMNKSRSPTNNIEENY